MQFTKDGVWHAPVTEFSTISKGDGRNGKIDSATILTKILQYSYNVGFDQFRVDFAKAIDGCLSETYAYEKMAEMRTAPRAALLQP